MMRRLRRLFWLGLLGGGGYGAYRVWSQRQSPSPAPQWPAMPITDSITDSITKPVAKPAANSVAATDGSQSEAPSASWLAPVNGSCPEGYPVKANNNSRIFHVPGGRFYARTVAERCYASADDAIADGYRPAKA